MSKAKRKTTTSSAVKNRYNSKTYSSYMLRIRKDSELNELLITYKQSKSVNALITELLKDYFEKIKK